MNVPIHLKQLLSSFNFNLAIQYFSATTTTTTSTTTA